MEESSCGLGLGWGLRSLGVSRHWSVDGGRGVRLNHRGLVVSLDIWCTGRPREPSRSRGGGLGQSEDGVGCGLVGWRGDGACGLP